MYAQDRPWSNIGSQVTNSEDRVELQEDEWYVLRTNFAKIYIFWVILAKLYVS